jgi:transmembrane sensor
LKPGAIINVDFRPDVRGVTLVHGEAHFQVTKDPARPFIVTARSVAVRAVGTAFSVDLGHDVVEVLVTEGSVAVDRDPVPIMNGAAQSLPMKLATVEAGSRLIVESMQMIALTPAAAVEPVGPAELSERLAWRTPRLEFSGTPLMEAVTLVNRHNRVKFVIDDPALANVRVSGLLRADNTEGFLELLRVSLGVETEPRGDFVIGLRRAR